MAQLGSHAPTLAHQHNVVASQVAARYGLDAGTVEEALLDFEARGWVRHLSFGGTAGWSLTHAGRAENERRLAAELGRAAASDAVTGAHASFLPLNRRLGDACTRWQIRPAPADPMVFNPVPRRSAGHARDTARNGRRCAVKLQVRPGMAVNLGG